MSTCPELMLPLIVLSRPGISTPKELKEIGLSTVEVNEVDLDLPDNIIFRLSNENNPLENSSAFAIDIFQRALEFLENLLSNHSSQ